MGRIYLSLDYPGANSGSKTTLTGIRYKYHQYYITGNYTSNGTSLAFLYIGDLTGRPSNDNIFYTLSYPGAQTTALYGPDVLSRNLIRVVGNYTDAKGEPTACMYTGPPNGSGHWVSLTPNIEAIHSIAHSTSHHLVVGNYLLKPSPLNRAYIYDTISGKYHQIIKPKAVYVTAYGIWYNGCGIYTICGGYSNANIISKIGSGYIVDWDGHQFSNWRSYEYDDDSGKQAIITHFDGISADRDGYELTGQAVVLHDDNEKSQGFVAKVRRHRNGTFSSARWEALNYPDSDLTTGNSIAHNVALGVTILSDDPDTVHGYLGVE
jgi:hypothetical protein